MNEKLSAQLELWKTVNEYANRIELSYQFFYTLLISVVGIVVACCRDNLIPERFLDGRFIVLCFAPIVVSTVIGYLAYNFRWVAIARMYSAALEKEINSSLAKDFFVWDSDLVNRFMAKKNFVNRGFLPAVNILFVLLVAGVLIYLMFASEIDLFIKIAYSLIIVLLFAGASVSFLGNERIRKSKYEFVVKKGEK